RRPRVPGTGLPCDRNSSSRLQEHLRMSPCPSGGHEGTPTENGQVVDDRLARSRAALPEAHEGGWLHDSLGTRRWPKQGGRRSHSSGAEGGRNLGTSRGICLQRVLRIRGVRRDRSVLETRRSSSPAVVPRAPVSCPLPRL